MFEDRTLNPGLRHPDRTQPPLFSDNQDSTQKGLDVITGGQTPDGKQTDNTGAGGTVGDILGEAAAATGVDVGQTKDGKPTVLFPDGSRATGHPESKTTGGLSIEVRTPKGRVKVKTREDNF